MNQLIGNIQAWFVSRGGFSHFMAGLFGTAVAAYAMVPPFHALVLQIQATLPAGVEDAVTAALGIYVWYHNSRSPAGVLAAARTITASPDAPTASAVDAATTK